MYILKQMWKGLRWLFLLPQVMIDVAALAVCIQIIFLGNDPMIADPEGLSVFLFFVQMILAAVVMIFVPRHFYKNGPPLYKGRWDNEPQEVSLKHFPNYLHAQLPKPEKYIHYASWGFKIILLVCLWLRTPTPITAEGSEDFFANDMRVSMFCWAILSGVVWLDLYSYIRSKNRKK